MTTDELKARTKLTHKAFQQMVVDLARLRGWEVYFTHDSRHSPAGWLDLFCLRGKLRMAIELKVGRDKLRLAQQRCITLLERADIPCYVVRPENWSDIEALLE